MLSSVLAVCLMYVSLTVMIFKAFFFMLSTNQFFVT